MATVTNKVMRTCEVCLEESNDCELLQTRISFVKVFVCAKCRKALNIPITSTTDKDRLNDIIHRAISWAQERGITKDGIASVLVEEYNALNVYFWDFFDYDEIAETMRY